MAAHRYWRLRGDRHRGEGFGGYCLTLLVECEFRATIGGTSNATGGTAFGSPGYGGSGEDPSAAFDGNTGTFWQGYSTLAGSDRFAGSTWTDHHILGYDFGSGNSWDIQQIALVWHASYPSRRWTHFVVESSDVGGTDPADWSYEWECFIGDAEAASGATLLCTRPQVTEETATKWGLLHLRGGNPAYDGNDHRGCHLAVSNIYFGSFGYVGAQTGFASEPLSGYPASNATDGSLSTFSHSNIEQAAYLGCEFDYAPGRPISITVWPRAGEYRWQSPVEWAMAYFDSDPHSCIRVTEGTLPEAAWADDSPRGLTAAPPVFDTPTTASYTGDWETFTVEEDGLLLTKLWGAGGHGGQYSGGNWGGGGGYVYAELIVNEGDVVAVQVGGGGYNRDSADGDNRGTGGWPDGGTGSYGDTWGGGGGGSSRVWVNGELALVAGGGGGAAGYSGKGGGGGGYASNDNGGGNNYNLTPYYGTGGAGTVDGPYLPKNYPGYGGNNHGWKIGRGILEVGALGRTGGHGGSLLDGTGDDGAGGGGGFYGGGGGGGDGCAAGGGASWLNPDWYSYGFQTNAISRPPGRVDDDDYPGSPIGYGQVSNSSSQAGDGACVFSGVAISPGGAAPAVVWADAFDRPPDSGSSDYQGYTVRCAIAAGQFIAEGNTIRLGFRGADTVGMRIDELWVGKGVGGTGYAQCGFADTPVQVSWDGGAVTAIDLEPGEQKWSDPIEFTIDNVNHLVVSAYFDTSGPAYHLRGYDSSNDKWIGYNGDPAKVVPVNGVWSFASGTYNPATMDAPGTGGFSYGGNDPYHFLDGLLVAAVEPEIDIQEGVGAAAATSTASATSVTLGNGTADGHASAVGTAIGVGQAVLPGDMQGTATATGSASAVSFVPGVVTGHASGTGLAIGVIQVRYGIVGTATAVSAGSGNGFPITRRPTVGSASGTGLAIGQLQTLGPNPAAGLSSGLGTALGRITVIAARDGTAAATSTADAAILALGTIETVGTAFGYAMTSSGVFATGVLNVAGEAVAVGEALAVGTIVSGSVGAATAAGTADAGGSYKPSDIVGRAAGIMTVNGRVEKLVRAIGNASGLGEAKGLSVAIFGSVGIASTTSAAYGVPDSVRELVGSAGATSTAGALATGLAPAAGAAAASSTGTSVSLALAPGVGTASALGTAAGVSLSLAPTTGTATGTTTGTGTAASRGETTGTGTGTSTAASVSVTFHQGVGSATAGSTAAANSVAHFTSVGRAAATSSATSSAANIGVTPVPDRIIIVERRDRIIFVPPEPPTSRVLVVAPRDRVVVVPGRGRTLVG